jgi:hypothetical protein
MVPGFFEWLGREGNHSPPSSAKIWNDWSCASTYPICLHGVDRENFTFSLNVITAFFLFHVG